MPAPGDQHASVIANPFEEPRQRITSYTEKEIATLQSRLERQLGPEYLSTRAGPSGTKVHYVAAEKVIALANDVFGFNGWSSSIKEVQVDFVDEDARSGKISLGLSVIVRVTLRDGAFHEDIGYGQIKNCANKAQAFEKAKKEGTTDALKRALRNFGNVLGNCLKDKDYLNKVTKMKVERSRGWDEGRLHRHEDYVKKEIKSEAPAAPVMAAVGNGGQSAMDAFEEDLMGEFDEMDFSIVDDEHPDEVSLPQSREPTPQLTTNRPNPQSMQPPSRPLGRSQSAGQPARPPQTPGQANTRSGPQPNQAAARPPQQINQPRPQGGNSVQASNSSNSSNHGPQHTPPGQNNITAPGSEAVGFFSARAVKQFAGQREDEEAKLPTAPMHAHAFNPHAESPSIRKTPGIDHTTSKPVGRNGQHVAPQKNDGDSGAKNPGPTTGTSVGAGAGRGALGGGSVGNGGQQNGSLLAQRGNVANPQMSQTRRIGAPLGAASPLANRGQYRPPTIKRPLPNEVNNGGARPALAEATTNGRVNAAAVGGAIGGDPKRQKMS